MCNALSGVLRVKNLVRSGRLVLWKDLDGCTDRNGLCVGKVRRGGECGIGDGLVMFGYVACLTVVSVVPVTMLA